MVIQIFAFVVGLYLVAESIAAGAQMHCGDKPCRLAKYLLIATAGLCLMFRPAGLDALHIALGLAIALGLWPKMAVRYWLLRGGR